MMTPVILFLFIVLMGNALGKVNVRGISLGVSGVLLVAIAMGYLLSLFCPSDLPNDFDSAAILFSKLGTSLFVSVIGLSAGGSIAEGSFKNNVICFLVGSAMSISGLVVTQLIGLLDRTIDNSLLLGILCGALTSTPGLATVCEAERMSSELAVMGYGAAYLFGVVGVVLFVQYKIRKYKEKWCEDREKRPVRKDTYEVLIPLCLVGILGQWVGTFRIPCSQWTIGSTGGMLVCGIVIGFLIFRFGVKKLPEAGSLRFYRDFGLTMFFVGTGFSAGQKLNVQLELRCFFYGALITMVALAVGCFLCKCVVKSERSKYISVIAGGMTSTPAFGTLLKCNASLADTSLYSLAYLGALIAVVLGVKFICS